MLAAYRQRLLVHGLDMTYKRNCIDLETIETLYKNNELNSKEAILHIIDHLKETTPRKPTMTPDRFKQLDRTIMACAVNIGTMSVASRNKVGAVLFKDGNIISMGWNGMPSGFPNELIEIGNVTNPHVLHAESNALMKCAKNGNGTSNGATLYVTLSPCVECSKLIIQSGVKKVIYKEAYRISTGIDLLRKANIEVEHLDV